MGGLWDLNSQTCSMVVYVDHICYRLVKNDNKWQEYKAEIQAMDTTTAGRLAIELPENGVYYFDYVSLFPKDTYKGRENGMRKDVAEVIEGLKPAFIRWPGGCIVEGITLNNHVQWKKTLGDPAARPGEYDTWGYHNSYGFGYKEFLDFCEDVGAKGMYVCNVGLACQYRSGEACSDKEAEGYLQDALDAIEYAIGGTDTEWGALRAKEGHPEPHGLKRPGQISDMKRSHRKPAVSRYLHSPEDRAGDGTDFPLFHLADRNRLFIDVIPSGIIPEQISRRINIQFLKQLLGLLSDPFNLPDGGPLRHRAPP